MKWWTEFWTWVNENQLAATIIGGLILAAIIWLITLLPKVGPHVRTFLEWLWSWRPISARRHERDLNGLAEMLLDQSRVDAKRLADKAVAAYFMPSLEEQAEKIDRGKKFANDKQASLSAMTTGLKTLHQAADSVSPSTPPAPPPPDPRWKLRRLSSDPDAKEWHLRLANQLPGSVAYNVRIDPTSEGQFVINDAAFWPDLSNRPGDPKSKAYGDFSGELKATNHANKFRLKLSWLDHDHKPRAEVFVIDGPPKWASKVIQEPF